MYNWSNNGVIIVIKVAICIFYIRIYVISKIFPLLCSYYNKLE